MQKLKCRYVCVIGSTARKNANIDANDPNYQIVIPPHCTTTSRIPIFLKFRHLTVDSTPTVSTSPTKSTKPMRWAWRWFLKNRPTTKIPRVPRVELWMLHNPQLTTYKNHPKLQFAKLLIRITGYLEKMELVLCWNNDMYNGFLRLQFHILVCLKSLKVFLKFLVWKPCQVLLPYHLSIFTDSTARSDAPTSLASMGMPSVTSFLAGYGVPALATYLVA